MTITYVTPVEAEVAVGDFFVSSWGYDQTNIDWYKVVALTPKGIKVQQWASKGGGGNEGPQVAVVPGDQPATRTDWSSGEAVQVDAPVLQKRLASFGSGSIWFHVNSYASAQKWDGKPEYRTGAGWGH